MRVTTPFDLHVVPPASSSSSRSSASARHSDVEPPRAARRLRRLPWIPLGLTLLVALSALMAVPPIRDAATGSVVEEARLVIPASYLVLSPLFDVLDTLTLLSVRQHVAVLVSLLLLWAIWRGWPRRSAVVSERPLGRRVVREAGLFAAYLIGIVGVYALMALTPRPMARLVLTDLDVLAADVHAHTQYSHDGRDGWTAERVRRWAADGGYDVVYISDHRTLEGVEEALPNNPAVAGQGTVLLPALEVVLRGERVNVLSFGSTYAGITDAALRDIDDGSLRLASLVRGKEPVLVQTVPADLAKVVGHAGPGTPGVRAIEVVDGSPRGLGQTRRQRARIVRMADSLGLALVAGSDNHGYGRTVPGWTLFRVPGWRNAAPVQLAEELERQIREGGRAATRVAERRVAEPGDSVLQLVLAAPIAFWRMLTTLSLEQRLMWVIWIWALTLVAVTWRVGRARRAARA